VVEDARRYPVLHRLARLPGRVEVLLGGLVDRVPVGYDDVAVAYRDVGHPGRPVLPHALDQVVHQHLELRVGHPARRGGGRGPRPAAAGAARQREHSDEYHSRGGPPTARTHPHDASPPRRAACVAAPARDFRTAASPRSPHPTVAAAAGGYIT